MRTPVQEVKVFGVQDRRSNPKAKRPWVVRWSINGRQRAKSFRTKAEGERYRSLLLQAQHTGERFDEQTGRPQSWHPDADDLAVHVWARQWVAEQWPEWQPRTRGSAVEALARFIPLVIASGAPAPPAGLRAHLIATLGPDAGPARRQRQGAVARPVVSAPRPARSGPPGGCRPAPRRGRRRPGAVGVDGGALPQGAAGLRPPGGRAGDPSGRPVAAGADGSVPAQGHPDPQERRRPGPARSVHHGQGHRRHRQPSAGQPHVPGDDGGRLLRRAATVGVVMLRASCLDLPAAGWGSIDVREADVSFGEPGEPKTGQRSVPIPRQLVDMLRRWLDERGFEGDELIFRTRTGARPTASNWARAWKRALREVGHPPLRVYDCRHAAATTWLRAGVPLGEVARRMGHGVETLVSTYVGALAGDEAVANERIEAVLSALPAE